MATLGELREYVRSALDERVSAFFTDEELDRWIYEGARDVARRARCLAGIKSVPIKVGSQTIDAPQDMIKIQRIEYVQSSTYRYALEFRDINSMDEIWYSSRTVTEGSPYIWTWHGFTGQDSSQIYLYPAPSAGISIDIFYYRLPIKPVNDNSQVEIPSGWEDIIPLYVEMNGRRKDDDQRWTEAQTLYEARLSQLIDATTQPSDQMRFVSADSGGIPFWANGGDW